MLFLWQTPLSDVIPLTRSFQSGTPGGTNALGLECQGRSASDNCLEFRQLAIGGTLTGVVVAPVLSFPVAGIIDGSNSYSTTVDGITMTIDKPSPGSLSLFNGNLSFGDVNGIAVTLLSFDVSFDSRVWLTSLDQIGSIGTVTFSIVGNGVASYGNTITNPIGAPNNAGELPFVGGPLQLQPGDRYTFSAVTGGSGLDGMIIASFSAVGSPACTQEDYVLLTQAEVDAFPQDCVSVGGSIDIVSSADITNVDSLSNVTSVGGYLKIKHNDALINLDGLSGLTSVGGYLKIKYNNVLTHCQGLAPVLGWPSGPPNDSVGEGISIFSNGGTECDSVGAILASVSGPTQPVINTATGRDQSISLAFSPSITPDVLFPISDYEAVCSGLTEIETAQGVGSPLSVGNLTNYREYDCTVAPVTRLGTLPLSSSVSAIAGAVPPSAPQITSIDSGSAEVSINVSVADDGGSPIRFYDAYCLDDSNIYQGSSLTSPITVSGLTPGETYVCLATATNDIGTSSLSAFSAAVIPEGSADTDADGVPDLIDNCVSIPNADQEPSFVPGCGAACVTSSCAGTICVNH